MNVRMTICLRIEGKNFCVPTQDESGIELLKDKKVPLCDLRAMANLAKTFEGNWIIYD